MLLDLVNVLIAMKLSSQFVLCKGNNSYEKNVTNV